MKFHEAFARVREHHEKIWFRCPSLAGNDPELRSSERKGTTLVSATGRILAFQTGRWFEWLVTPAHSGPADQQAENDSDADWPADDGFPNRVRTAHELGIVRHNS